MPLPLFVIAYPVLHSSGAWIASTSAAGYVAGTMSSTWIGSFILGNAALLAKLGLVSVASVFSAGAAGVSAWASGAAAAASGVLSSTATGLGAGLSAIGLGGVANALGIAPAVTFLGLTPVGWGLAATALATAGLGYYLTRKTLASYFDEATLRRMNEERANGGLGPISIPDLINEIRRFEEKSIEFILERLSGERSDVKVSEERTEATIAGQIFSLSRLKYVIQKDGTEEIVFITRGAQS